jgi:hypothetical protein
LCPGLVLSTSTSTLYTGSLSTPRSSLVFLKPLPPRCKHESQSTPSGCSAHGCADETYIGFSARTIADCMNSAGRNKRKTRIRSGQHQQDDAGVGMIDSTRLDSTPLTAPTHCQAILQALPARRRIGVTPLEERPSDESSEVLDQAIDLSSLSARESDRTGSRIGPAAASWTSPSSPCRGRWLSRGGPAPGIVLDGG